jgi:hypothetical protein
MSTVVSAGPGTGRTSTRTGASSGRKTSTARLLLTSRTAGAEAGTTSSKVGSPSLRISINAGGAEVGGRTSTIATPAAAEISIRAGGSANG